MFELCYQLAIRACIALVNRGLVPDAILRVGLRLLIGWSRATRKSGSFTQHLFGHSSANNADKFWPVWSALQLDAELPAAYYQLVLGRQLKDSCCLFPDPGMTLDEAEDSMLELTCQRAQLTDGQAILHLNCGWGSLTLYIAAKHPTSRVTAVCNSRSQKLYVSKQCRQRGLTNVKLVLRDSRSFDVGTQYDRVLKIEGPQQPGVLQAIWHGAGQQLKADGLLFMQEERHQSEQYPSQEELVLVKKWFVNGQNYAKTALAWLRNLDQQHKAIMPILQEKYGPHHCQKLCMQCRLIYMMMGEQFRHSAGTNWGVAHVLYQKRS